jgi:hypothetical protein
MKLTAIALFLLAQASPFDSVRTEPNPEKRYWKALEFGSSQIVEARKLYSEGKPAEFTQALDLVTQAVQLCDETLRGTGKNPAKYPKHFKKAELKIREIMRRLTSFEEEVSIDDRPTVANAKKQVQKLHEELLFDIMGRRK